MTRGEVVLVDWPFSDRTGTKLRPAVVIQSDSLNQLIADTILIAVTRKSRAAATEVILDPRVETSSGLTHRSIASCTNILTVDQALIFRQLGDLSVGAIKQIEARLRIVMDLP